jgi:hypothetical protein
MLFDYYQKFGNVHFNLILKLINQGINYLEHFDGHPFSSLHPPEVLISSSEFVRCVRPSRSEWSLGLE